MGLGQGFEDCPQMPHRNLDRKDFPAPVVPDENVMPRGAGHLRNVHEDRFLPFVLRPCKITIILSKMPVKSWLHQLMIMPILPAYKAHVPSAISQRMLDAEIMGHSPPKFVLSNRFLMRRLRAAGFCRILAFTRQPSVP
jgi:hypothetical protein